MKFEILFTLCTALRGEDGQAQSQPRGQTTRKYSFLNNGLNVSFSVCDLAAVLVDLARLSAVGRSNCFAQLQTQFKSNRNFMVLWKNLWIYVLSVVALTAAAWEDTRHCPALTTGHQPATVISAPPPRGFLNISTFYLGRPSSPSQSLISLLTTNSSRSAAAAS